MTVRTVDIHPEDGTLDLDDLEREDLRADPPRGRRLRLERARHDQPGRRDHPPGPCRGCAGVHRCGPFRASRPDRRARPSTPTSSPARPTSSSGRTSARCTARKRVLDGLPAYKVGRPTIASRPGRRTSRRSPARLPRSTTWPGSANASAQLVPAEFPGLTGRRLDLKTAMRAIRAYELELFGQLVDGLERIPGAPPVGDHAIGPGSTERTPTAAVTFDGLRRGPRPRRSGGRGSPPGTATSTPRP